jgi:hypothetical protein
MPKATDKISVREATANDIPQLCELLAILFTQEADFKPDARKQARGLRLLLDQPETGRVFCATEGNTVIGMVSILFTVSPPRVVVLRGWKTWSSVRPGAANRLVGDYCRRQSAGRGPRAVAASRC